MNVLIAMTALAVGRPTVDDSPGQVAEWYQAKSRLHRYLAEQGGQDAAQETAYAVAAYEHARALLRRA